MADVEAVRRARAFVDSCKTGQLCADCGGSFAARVLRFEHRRGVEKRRSIGKMAQDGAPPEEIAAEMEKCDLICANCSILRQDPMHGMREFLA